MKYSSRFFLYAPLALFLCLATGVGIYWWIAAGALSAKLDALNGHAAMPGVTLSFKSKTVSGFPFNLDVVFDDVRLTVDTPHGPSSWTSEKFALHALTYGRDQVLFEAAGHQHLTWTDLKGGRHAMPFETGSLHASAILGTKGLARLDIDLVGFGSPALSAGRVQLHARIAPSADAIDLFATADSVHLSPPIRSAFGADVQTVKLDATAIPGHPFDSLRDGRSDWVGAFEGWRKGSGVLRVNALEIDIDRLSAMGKGMLSLDDAHAVRGALDFKIAGMQPWLAAFARHGSDGLGPNNGVAAALIDRGLKAGLNDAGVVGAVFQFQDGQVIVGDEAATSEEPLY